MNAQLIQAMPLSFAGAYSVLGYYFSFYLFIIALIVINFPTL